MKDYYCYINFELEKYSKARLHISDVGLHRGYGIFDYFRSRNGKLLWLDDYMDRLFRSIKKAKLKVDFSKDEFVAVIEELHEINKIKDSYFKILITGGYSEDFYTTGHHPNVIIINQPFKALPVDIYKAGANLISLKYQRSNPLIKSLNYFDSVSTQSKREKYKAIDVLYLDKYIYEASRSNVFLIKKNQIFTPSNCVLQGVTRKNVIKMIKGKFDLSITKIRADQLFEFDEIFLTGTGKDILPIVKIDKQKIGSGKPGKVTKKIMERFKKQF